MSVLLSLLAKFWPYLVGAVGLGVAALKLRQSGAKAERAKQAAEAQKARTIADEIDDAIAGREPARNREELKSWRAR